MLRGKKFREQFLATYGLSPRAWRQRRRRRRGFGQNDNAADESRRRRRQSSTVALHVSSIQINGSTLNVGGQQHHPRANSFSTLQSPI